MSSNPFEELVGQKNVKKKLNFYLKAFGKTNLCPFFGFFGAKGLGKTAFAEAFASGLTNTDGSQRKYMHINSSTIKNNDQFFEQIYIPQMLEKEITIFFDEAHELPMDLTTALLTILDTSSNHIRHFAWRETSYSFNFKHHTFMFATTESNKLFPPLKDRLTSIDFDSYSNKELGQILKLGAECDIDFDVLDGLSSVVRGNARNAMMKAKDINLYAEAEGVKVFDKQDYDKFCDTLGILPFGITCTEKQILKVLDEKGTCTLSFLAAKLGLSPASLRCDHESYLLRKNLMEIDGKRKITPLGRKLIESI